MIFRRAAIRLTILFSAVLLLVFGIVALGVYAFVTTSFDYDAAANAGTAVVDVAEMNFDRLRTGLIVGYIGLGIVVPFLAFALVTRTLRPARRGYEAQQRFVDDASHEFRTPLSIIQGELELAVSRPRTSTEYVAAIATALDEVGHLTELTDNLLALTRGDGRDLRAMFTAVDMQRVIGRVVGVDAANPSAQRIRVETVESMRVHGSEDLLVRAIANLLDNALKFSPASSLVTVRATGTAERVTVEVIDSGPGFTPDELARAYDRFWRAPAARALPGHGLGLSLVREIVAAHRGSIEIVSEAGNTTATLRLERTT